MPSCPGSTARIPPPTPLFAGRPTEVTQSPAPSYIPHVVMTLSNRCAVSLEKTVRPVRGFIPPFAIVAPIPARSSVVTRIEHCR